MFISSSSTPFPPKVWARWGGFAEDVEGKLFLHFGPDFTVMLSMSELLELQLQIAAAMDMGPQSLDQAAEKAEA